MLNIIILVTLMLVEFGYMKILNQKQEYTYTVDFKAIFTFISDILSFK